MLEEIAETASTMAAKGDEQFIGPARSKLQCSFDVGRREGLAAGSTGESPPSLVTRYPGGM